MVALQNTSTLLTYAMMTMPSPVSVSPSPQNPAQLVLTIVVSCPRNVGVAMVSQIGVTLPVGKGASPDPTDLTETAPPASAASITSTGGEQWTAAAGLAPGVFLLTPPGGMFPVAQGSLTITIVGIAVSTLVGTALITINEWAAQGNAQPPPPRSAPSGTGTIAVAKFPSGFYAFDFTAGTPQINSGQTVTLSWVGSTNAIYTLKYADQSVSVSAVRSWTSPPLYTTTAFILTASSTQNGQTVSLDLSTVVIIAAPAVVSFTATPSEIDYNQTVTLDWRSTSADGVYFLTGQTGRETLGAVSDPNHPKTLVPQFGQSYALQAFKHDPSGAGQSVSAVYPLAITFNPIVINRFDANPTTVDLNHQATQLTWDVAHAKSVAYQGQTVAAQGSRQEHPTGDTTYQLVATWVDGTTQAATAPVKVVKVQVSGISAHFQVQGTTVTVVLTFQCANVTGGSVANAHLMFCDRVHWYIWGHNHTSGNQSATIIKVNDSTWQATLTYQNTPTEWSGLPNVGIAFDWRLEGFQPQGENGRMMMWKGAFSFWQHS
jgi:hypothetical protein